MSIAVQPPPECPEEVWQRFLKTLANQGIRQHQWRWYAYRVEQYLKATDGRVLVQHTAADVDRFLEALGRSGRMEDWQFGQAVDALRFLFAEAVGATWPTDVDWGHWTDSARSLGRKHATVVRER